MADTHYIRFTCPNCGKTHNFKIYDGINIKENPELKDRVLNASIFSFTCSKCGYETGITYPFVYHDPVHRFMIELTDGNNAKDPFESAISGEDERSKALQKVYENMKTSFKFRNVDNPNDLIEKIIILEKGFDDRAIEIQKLYVKSTVVLEQGTELYGLLFNPEENGPNFVLETDEGFIGTVKFDLEIYNKIMSDYIEKLPQDLATETVIDSGWAMKVMSQELGMKN